MVALDCIRLAYGSMVTFCELGNNLLASTEAADLLIKKSMNHPSTIHNST
jgi:hypothetical protein